MEHPVRRTLSCGLPCWHVSSPSHCSLKTGLTPPASQRRSESPSADVRTFANKPLYAPRCCLRVSRQGACPITSRRGDPAVPRGDGGGNDRPIEPSPAVAGDDLAPRHFVALPTPEKGAPHPSARSHRKRKMNREEKQDRRAGRTRPVLPWSPSLRMHTCAQQLPRSV